MSDMGDTRDTSDPSDPIGVNAASTYGSINTAGSFNDTPLSYSFLLLSISTSISSHVLYIYRPRYGRQE
jgi:hypothetical protein